MLLNVLNGFENNYPNKNLFIMKKLLFIYILFLVVTSCRYNENPKNNIEIPINQYHADTLLQIFRNIKNVSIDTINTKNTKHKPNLNAIKLNNEAIELYSAVLGAPVTRIDSLLLDSAIVLLNKAIKIDKQYYIAYANKAMVNSKLNKYNEAIKTLDDIVKLKTDYAEGILSQGFLFEKIADSINARNKYNKAIEAYLKRLHDPNEINKVNVQVDIAFALLFTQGKDKSLQIIDTLSSWHPNNDAIKTMKMNILNFNKEKFIKDF